MKIDKIAEYDRVNRCFTGRYYVIQKMFGPDGDSLEYDRVNRVFTGRRYRLVKRFV